MRIMKIDGLIKQAAEAIGELACKKVGEIKWCVLK